MFICSEPSKAGHHLLENVQVPWNAMQGSKTYPGASANQTPLLSLPTADAPDLRLLYHCGCSQQACFFTSLPLLTLFHLPHPSCSQPYSNPSFKTQNRSYFLQELFPKTPNWVRYPFMYSLGFPNRALLSEIICYKLKYKRIKN